MINTSPAWQALTAHQRDMAKIHLKTLFQTDPQRFDRFSLNVENILLDYSKNIINDETLALLFQLWETAGLSTQTQALFSGEKINNTERRSVLHTALRADLSKPLVLDQEDIHGKVKTALEEMLTLASDILSGEWTNEHGQHMTDVVNIGIGGSDLGPHFVCEALKPFQQGQLNCHFVSNVDGTHLAETLKTLNPATTLFIVASKTFTTIETLSNAIEAKTWLLSNGVTEISKHFVAVTTAIQKASEFGIKHCLKMYDWVGGRYSLWSTIGFSIVLAIGEKNFKLLLAGAQAIDQHFKTAPFRQNMPVIMAMLGIWYHNFFKAETHAVIAYNQYLDLFCDYLQQLDMESNGKRLTKQGEVVTYSTGPIIWGGLGTNSQHAFHQLLHQGTHLIPVDFIATLKTHNPLGQQQAILYANCLSQSQALMIGKTIEEAKAELTNIRLHAETLEFLARHKEMPGNRPSNTLVLKDLDPRTLGSLIALYEHKVFVQGVIWDINSFDQWGVELGKQLANKLLPILQGQTVDDSLDSSTKGLANLFKNLL